VDDATADEQVVRALYELHGGPLLGFVLGLVGGDRQRAEDVVQETLLRAWRHPEALEEQRGSTRSWLFTVARNLVVDGVRARAVRPSEVSDTALLDVAAAVSVEAEVERAVLGWEVADALAELAAHHRDVLVQIFFLGRSVAEAAAALRIPAGTVKSRTYYALRQLRLVLEERGIGVDGLAGEATM
jgi:RNA polymerase sigma-70 factor (ECF subfamily)